LASDPREALRAWTPQKWRWVALIALMQHRQILLSLIRRHLLFAAHDPSV